MTVAVLVVNWNGGDLLARCLDSLARQRRRPDHIVVVDNGSSDDSLRIAESALRVVTSRTPPQVVVSKSASALAFAPDGHRLATVTDDGLQVWDRRNPRRPVARWTTRWTISEPSAAAGV